MGSYHGDVIVVDHEGEEHTAHAVLHSWTDEIEGPGERKLPGLRHWEGTLSGDVDWWASLEARLPIQLLVGDREGEAIIVRFDAAQTLGPVSIKGSGPAPFDD